MNYDFQIIKSGKNKIYIGKTVFLCAFCLLIQFRTIVNVFFDDFGNASIYKA